MERKPEKRSEKVEKEKKQPGHLSSFNKRDAQRSTETEDAKESMPGDDISSKKNPDEKDDLD